MKPPAVVVPSSPGRPTLPAPGLARLVTSKSRGRSAYRSSPMVLFARSRSAGRGAGESMGAGGGGEPSSPKVTCIGQVRMRKSKSGKKKEVEKLERGGSSSSSKCRCFKKPAALFCGGIFRPRRKWRWGTRADHKISNTSSAAAVVAESERAAEDQGPAGKKMMAEAPGKRQQDMKRFQGSELETATAATPPKNVLLLMRGRSAPQHLPRFLVPPPAMAAQQDEELKGSSNKEAEKLERQLETPAVEEEEEEEEEEELRCSSARPLVLTRCKSAPAAKAGRMVVPENNGGGCFWNSGSDNGEASRHRLTPPAVIGH